MTLALRAPFPWFGGKRRVADLIWARLGDVASYNEPFAGSLAVLLARPHVPRVETVNDLDCYLANFWRALQHDPEAVAYHADGPVNEADLHARHRWLVDVGRATLERVKVDPDFFDAKIAGWWVWGQCLWIGSGWCEAKQPPANTARPERGLVHPKGVHREQRTAKNRSGENPSRQRKRFRTDGDSGVHRQAHHVADKLVKNRGGNGVHAKRVAERRWQGGGQGGGSGVHAPRLSQQVPSLAGDSGSADRGVHAKALWQQRPDLSGRRGLELRTEGLFEYMHALAARLRRVRVCCGDWKRVLTPSVTTYIGVCGVFLDPPYAHDLRARCYAEDHDISADVRAWALEHGDDPNFRIALCGYEDEHGPHMPDSWDVVAWKAHGGYSRSERGVANRDRERIWFSPYCLKAELPLFRERASA